MHQVRPIAIVGVACRMPGGDGITDYWNLLQSGRSAIQRLPEGRLNRSLYFDPEQGKIGRSYSELGGVVADRPVNREICPISDKLIAEYDVAHLNLCEVASAALRDAGINPARATYPRTGVFIGHSGGSCLAGDLAFARYVEMAADLLRRHDEFKGCSPAQREVLAKRMVEQIRSEFPSSDAVRGANFGAANAAMLISRVHGFEGPSLVIDAACASSLMSVSQAAQALARGEVDMAIAGGASYSKWYGLVLFSMAMSISGSGSRPFDADADGLISADGYGAVVLKTLDRALADGDRILGVIRGIGVSSDGRGKSLWAPRPEGQMLAVQRAYSKEIDPTSLQYIECHATSTQVGDATELKTLSHVFPKELPNGRKIPIGSVKANIGHALEAAGIAGLVKTILAMKHQMIPPQINFNTPNPQIEWAKIPFEVASQGREWTKPSNGMPRRAAVNSFGIGGLNVHLVLDDGLLPGETGQSKVAVPAGISNLSTKRTASESTTQQPIAIIGTSVILPGALTKAALWDLLLSGKDPKQALPKGRSWDPEVMFERRRQKGEQIPCTRGGYISDFVYDWKRHKVPPKQIANANPLQFMLLDAADQALEDAGYGKREFDRTRASAVVGTIFGGDFAVQLQMGLRMPQMQRALRQLLEADGATPEVIEESLKQFERRILEVMPALMDETGSFTSSTLASRLTKSFDFCGGAFAIDSDEISGFAALNAAIGMLDTGASDLVLCASGQDSIGVNIFEMMQENDLLSQGEVRSVFDKQFDGVLPGEGVAVVVLKRLADAERDGDPIRAIIRGTGQCSRSGDIQLTMTEAFQNACEVAGAEPAKIGVVEMSGLESRERCSAVSDLVESIQEASGEQGVCVTSLTPQFGCIRGTGGIVSIVKSVLQLENGKVPATFGLSEVDSSAAAIASALPTALQPIYATTPEGKTLVAVNNNSESGSGFSVILESRQPLPRRQTPATPTIKAVPAQSTSSAAKGPAVPASHLVNRVALVFPGQGSYYQGMGAQLLEHFPAARQRLVELNEILRHEGCPQFAELAADPSSNILNAQLSMLVSELLFLAVYETSGRKPDVVCGHSYGEYAALVAAGALSFRDAVRATKHRADVVEQFGGKQGELLAVSADAIQVRQLLARSPAEVYLANINAPDQTVIGGLAEDLRTFEHLLNQKKISFRRLNVPAAYHTPLLEPALAAFRDCLRELPIVPPQIPVLTGVGNVPVVDPEAIRENLVMQLVTTMDYVGLVHVLQQRGIDTVVEVGPRHVLSQLARKTIGHTPVCFPMDAREATGPEYLRELLTKLAPAATVPSTTAKASLSRPVSATSPNNSPSMEDARSAMQPKPAIIHFDATARRKEQNRQKALKQRAAEVNEAAAIAAVPAAPPQPQVPPTPLVNHSAPASNGYSNGAANGHQNGKHVEPVPPAAIAPVAAPAPAPMASPAPAAAPRVLPKRAELQAFVVEYIVDQTGYPKEMVELDADLEADLGIDSIKKAQMLGECAQKFELHWLAGMVTDLSLDQFPTLESIIKFLTEDAGRGADAAPAAAAPVAAPAPAPVAPPTPVVTAPVVAAPVAAAPVATPVPPTPAPAAPAASGRVLPKRAELQTFVVDYIVDQTGYPAEMVELEADLEADLGIDSIKKAQMLGECAQKFELHWLAGMVTDLSLDQFPTLESIIKFLTEDAGRGGESTPVAAAPSPAPAPAPVAPAPVAPAPAYSAPVAAAPVAPAPVAPAPVAAPATPVAESNGRVLPKRAELQAFVVDYIVDQTGYPAEMVELEADLEADLGIDSIKKAQMLGECAQKFELHWLAGMVTDLSLDQFPTLESIIKFLTEDAGRSAPAASAPAPEPVAAPATAAPAPDPVVVADARQLQPPVAAPSVVVIEREPVIAASKLVTQIVCAGDPYQLGLEHGRHQRESIHAILERQISRYGNRLNNMPELDQALMEPTRYFGEAEVAELTGIADGAELPVGFIVAHNLGLCEDYVPGCVHFAITAQQNGRSGLIHAANEDSSLALSLTDSLKRIVQYRAPAQGYRHVVFSVTGQLCGINGTNEKGLTVSSTLLLDRAPRDVTAVGDIHPVLVKRILQNAATLDEAIEILKASRRNGAWSLCISHAATDSLCYVEYDSDQLEVRRNLQKLVGTNHALLLAPTHPTPPHSVHRLDRLNELLLQYEAQGVTSEDAEVSLRDQFDGRRQRFTAHPTMNTICRVDNQISVVMSPANGQIRITPGPAQRDIAGQYSTLTVADFLRSGSAAAGASAQQRQSPAVVPASAVTDPLKGLPPAADRVMRRVVLRPRQEPLPEANVFKFPLTGQALVYGADEVAVALVAKLRDSGLTVHQLPTQTTAEGVDSQFAAVCGETNIDHLFVVSSRTQADLQHGSITDRFLPIFRLCQLWGQRVAASGNIANSTMTAVTFSGGDFGLTGSPTSGDAGAMFGFWKALRREFGGFPARVVDVSSDEPANRVIEKLVVEFSQPFSKCEIAYSRGERFSLAAIPVPAAPVVGSGPTPGSAWIITGGARGVTAVVARELGKRFGVHLHLFGSSPVPNFDPSWATATPEQMKAVRRQVMAEARERGQVPINAWNEIERGLEIDATLREMRQAGISVTYHSTDVSNAQAVAKTIAEIRALNAPIEGVIHGAGVEAACRFDRKQMPSVKKTFEVKVEGAKILADALEFDPVRYFVGFGSTSGRFGGLGQSDYSAASDALSKFCNELGRRLPDCRTIAFHWPPWGEVGMAARPESKLALEAGGMAFMPPLEGAAFLLEELMSPIAEPEILLIDKPDSLDLDQTLPARAEWDDYAAAQARVESSPLLDTVVEFRRDRLARIEARLDAATDPFLYDHQHKNAPILPMAFGMELLAETLRVLVPEMTSLTMSNTEIVNGMRFYAERPELVTAKVERVGDHYVGELSTRFLNRKGVLLENERVLVRTTLKPGTSVPANGAVAALGAAAEAVSYADTWAQIGEPRFGSVFTGETLRGLTEISRAGQQFEGRIVPPSTAGFAGGRAAAGWIAAPAVLDACFIACDRWASLTHGRLHLPQKFGQVQFLRFIPDGEACRVTGQVKEITDNRIRFDFALWNGAGDQLLDAKDFEIVSASTAQVAASVATEQPSSPVSDASPAVPRLLFPVEAVTRNGETWEAELRIEPLTEPMLAEHRFQQSPMLPGVAMAEIFAEALRELIPGPGKPCIRDFRIHHSLHLKVALARRIQVIAKKASQGYSCQLIDVDGGEVLLATATVDRIADSVGEIPALDLPSAKFLPMQFQDANSLMYHGQPFRCLQEICLRRSAGWGTIVPTPMESLLGRNSTCEPMLHPAVLDSCFVACGVDAWIYNDGRVELPLGFDELVVLREQLPAPGEKMLVRVWNFENTERGSSYDLVLYDEQQQPVYFVKKYRSVAKGEVKL